MSEPASSPPPRRYKPHYVDRARRTEAVYPTMTLPPNDGRLTALLSNQKNFTKALICASLQAGLVPADAVERATDAVTWIRDRAIEQRFDSEDQHTVAMFVTASMRSPGATNGKTLAERGIEAMRLYKAWLVKVRRGEREKARRGEVQ